MRILKKHQGMAIPTVLAIVVFIIGTAASLLTITFNQSHLVEKNIDNSEERAEATENVDAAVRVIIRSLLSDSQFLSSSDNILEVENYFDVSIDPFPNSTSLWVVSSTYAETRVVTSYISTSSGGGMTEEEVTNLMAYFGQSSITDYNDMPETLLEAFLPSYFETQEIDATSDPKASDLDSVKSIATYVAKKTTFYEIAPFLLNQDHTLNEGTGIEGNFYVNGNLTIYSGNVLHIADGYVLVVTNNLTMQPNSHLIGNVIVGNTAVFQGNSSSLSTFRGTLFVGSGFTSSTEFVFGTDIRPTFVFSEGGVTLYKGGTGYAYFVTPRFTLDGDAQTILNINGGVYTDDLNIKGGEYIVTPYDISTIYHLFESYALPYDSAITQDGSYTYTNPQ